MRLAPTLSHSAACAAQAGSYCRSRWPPGQNPSIAEASASPASHGRRLIRNSCKSPGFSGKRLAGGHAVARSRAGAVGGPPAGTGLQLRRKRDRKARLTESRVPAARVIQPEAVGAPGPGGPAGPGRFQCSPESAADHKDLRYT